MNVNRLRKLIENPRYTKKKITLKDGRTLSYSECGNLESGMPVLFCFGLMTSSVAIMFAHQAALQNNLRILAVDYPGIGESTFQENRTLSGWADDIRQFCDKVLGACSRIRLLGHSLGGLHALALLSDRSFKERIVRTVLLSPWIYFEETQELHPPWITMAQTLPEVFRSSIIPTVLSNLSLGTINLVGWSNPHHTQLQAAKIVSEYATLQGTRGNEQMVRLALSKSEVNHIPSNLRSPIIVYHGSKDHLVLLESVSALVQQMNQRNCSASLVTVADADHNSIFSQANNLSKVMGAIVGEPDSWAKEIIVSLGGKTRSLPTPTKPKPKVKEPTSPQQQRNKGRLMSTKLFFSDQYDSDE
jgi:pimeloyl-ACP methyl ester carboxylesterase